MPQRLCRPSVAQQLDEQRELNDCSLRAVSARLIPDFARPRQTPPLRLPLSIGGWIGVESLSSFAADPDCRPLRESCIRDTGDECGPELIGGEGVLTQGDVAVEIG
jgi:hypothetical protein